MTRDRFGCPVHYHGAIGPITTPMDERVSSTCPAPSSSLIYHPPSLGISLHGSINGTTRARIGISLHGNHTFDDLIPLSRV